MPKRLQDAIPEEYAKIFLHLLQVGQKLVSQRHSVVELLCQEVGLATQGRVQLYLDRRDMLEKKSPFVVPVKFEIESQERIYGVLFLAPDEKFINCPAVPEHIASLIAKTCGWLLYIAETSEFIMKQCNRLNQEISGRLTRREQEVLALICQNYDQKQIASALCITPATVDKHRQHIYDQLRVHNEHDAILKAYWVGHYSPIKEEFSCLENDKNRIS